MSLAGVRGFVPSKKGAPLNMGHRRTGVGTRLKVAMRSDWANDLITGLKRVPTRVLGGAKMALEGSLNDQKGPLSLALHPHLMCAYKEHGFSSR